MASRRITSKIAAALILGAASVAHASGLDLTFHPEAGAGLTHYAIVPDGIWYQIGMQHSIQRSGRAWEFGVGGDIAEADAGITHFGLSYHVDYVNLGHARATCYCTTVDADYDAVAHRLIVPEAVAPKARYSGDGYVQGIKLAIAPYLTIRDYRIGYEFGEFFFRPSWRDTVYGWPASPTGPFLTGSNYTPSGIQRGRVFGFYVTRGHLTLSYENYRLPIGANERNTPPIYSGAQVLMLTYQF